MWRERGEGVARGAGCRWAAWVGSWAVAAGLAGCGGGGDAESGSPPPSGGNPPAAGNTACTVAKGTGSLRVPVTDAFGEAVVGANVAWVRPGIGTFSSTLTDSAGVARIASLPACEGWVEVNHTVRGLGRAGDESAPLAIRKDEVLDVPVGLEPIRQPAAAVLSASVGPGGVSADGRSLDVTLRIAVTGGREGESWLIGGAGAGVDAAACQARTGTELAELGPRCIRGLDGSDRSYSFARLNDLGVVRKAEEVPPSWSVGLLVDQSAAGLTYWAGGSAHAPNDPRLFAARFLVDGLLPDTPLALAGFASDLAPGGASTLPQRPVTFFPVEAPGFTTSRVAAFETLHDLSDMVGGGAPLHEAISIAVNFMAARTPAGRKPMLVVLADGGDKDCGTLAQCSAARRGIVAQARAEGVELFLVGTDDVACSDPPSDQCLEIRAQEPLRSLAAEGGYPLVLSDEPWFDYCGAWGPCPAFAGMLVSPLEMVAGWLTGTAQVQEVSIRLNSESPGAFAPGAVVMGELLGSNEDMCPWGDGYCWRYSLPFRVEVPE